MSHAKGFFSRVPHLLTAFAVMCATVVALSGNVAFARDVGDTTGGRTLANSVVNSNLMYSMQNIQYQLYTDASATTAAKTSNGANAIITLKADGTTNGDPLELTPGQYYAREVQSSTLGKGYRYNNKIYSVKVESTDTKTNPVTINAIDTPYAVQLNLVKQGEYERLSNGTVLYGAETVGDASLANAVFRVRYYGGNVSQAAIVGNSVPSDVTVRRTWHFVTDAQGRINMSTATGYGTVANVFNPATGTKSAKSYTSSNFYTDTNNNRVYLLGTYYIDELDPPEGYTLDASNKFYRYVSSGDAEAIDTNASLSEAQYPRVQLNFSARNNIIRGAISVEKQNNKTAHDERGDTSQDATFAIINKSKSYVYYNGDTSRKIQPNSEVCRITAVEQADGKWVASTPDNALIYGTYLVKEVDPMTGGFLDDGFEETIVIHTAGRKTATHVYKNEVKKGSVRVRKSDAVTGDRLNGDMKLDATFAVVNASEDFVLYNDDPSKKYQPGEIVTTIKAEKLDNGQWWAETPARSLDYGTYIVYEYNIAEGHKEGNEDKSFTRPSYTVTYKNGSNVTVNKTIPATTFTLANAVEDGYKPEVIHVREDGQVIELGAEKTFLNEPKYNGLKLLKVDWDERFVPLADLYNIDLGEGDATLLGAEFTIVNHSENEVYVGPLHGIKQFDPVNNVVDDAVADENNWKPVDGDVMTIVVVAVTDDEVVLAYFPDRDGARAVASTESIEYNGETTEGNERLPYGTYNIRETKAPDGYRLQYDKEFWYMNGEHNQMHDGDRTWYMVDGKDLMKYITSLHVDIIDPTYRDYYVE